MFERSRFSRKFISVRKVLKILAFRSSVRCSPLVATRARHSPVLRDELHDFALPFLWRVAQRRLPPHL